MIVYNIITALCLALLVLSVVFVIVGFFRKESRAERITFIRGFKKGKCVAVFLIALPLFCIGYVYGGNSVFDGILNAITHVIELVILKFNLNKIGALIEANLFYKITVYCFCVVLILNAILFAFSFIAQRLWQWKNSVRRIFSKKERLILFGNNRENYSIFASADNKKYLAAVAAGISSADGLELYKKKIGYISCKDYGGLIRNILKKALNGKKYSIVVNTRSDEENLNLCKLFNEGIAQFEEEKRIGLFHRLRIFVFGDPSYETVYEQASRISCGCIRYKNKYRMIAMDFVDRFPLTKFLDERQIDYKTSLIKPDININVCMVGFGKPNTQIFLTSVANNQFVTEQNGGTVLKKVHYYIFDKNDSVRNKNLNHSYRRYLNKKDGFDKKDYLPLPEVPAETNYLSCDVNSPEFYSDLRKIVCKSENDANFLIVSFENDLENIDLTQKLMEKFDEWQAKNLIAFVRSVKSPDSYFEFRRNNVFCIGNESECVFDIEKIIGDKIYRMAQQRNEIYDLEYKITNDKDFRLSEEAVTENALSANKNWFVAKSQLERESSLYGCLSLQSKLNLMGLEYVRNDENDLPALSEQEYLAYYAGDDLPDASAYSLRVDGKSVIKYTLDFRLSRRKTLAVLEHYRWNSFMLSKGVIPASRERILNETEERNGKLRHTNGKNYRLRRHGNLTTFEGLTEFRQMIARRDHCEEIDCDVIKYDYQILDDAYWLLTKNGYKIVKRVSHSQ